MPSTNTIFSSLQELPDTQGYLLARANYFKDIENPGLQELGVTGKSPVHNDGKNYATIGYGYNLTDWNEGENTYKRTLEINTDFFTHVFGTLTEEQELALQIIDDFNAKREVAIGSSTRVLTIEDLEDGANSVDIEGQPPHPLSALRSLTLTEPQASAMLTAYLDGIPGYEGAESRLDAKLVTFSQANNLPTEDPISLPPSEERLAVLSMFYQNPALVGDGLMTALMNDNRAEAWFQIRYKHLNHDVEGLQNRKNAESDKFGLTRTDDLEEYAEALGHLYTNHRQTIDERDENSPFLDAIATQKTALEQAYTNGETVDFIYLGTNSSAHEDKLGGNDLIFGDPSDSSTLYGYGGNDFLIGGTGNDMLDGGDGNDTLHGGRGSDTLNGGAGNDDLFGGNDNVTDLIEGGSGSDSFHLNHGDEFQDPDRAGEVYFGGKQVPLAEGKQVAQDSVAYDTGEGYQYQFVGDSLTIAFIAAFLGGGGVAGDGAIATTNLESSRVFFDIDTTDFVLHAQHSSLRHQSTLHFVSPLNKHRHAEVTSWTTR